MFCQPVRHGLGASLREFQVVLYRSPVVGVAFHHKVGIRMLVDDARFNLLQHGFGLWLQIVFVKVKQDGALHADTDSVGFLGDLRSLRLSERTGQPEDGPHGGCKL